MSFTVILSVGKMSDLFSFIPHLNVSFMERTNAAGILDIYPGRFIEKPHNGHKCAVDLWANRMTVCTLAVHDSESMTPSTWETYIIGTYMLLRLRKTDR